MFRLPFDAQSCALWAPPYIESGFAHWTGSAVCGMHTKLAVNTIYNTSLFFCRGGPRGRGGGAEWTNGRTERHFVEFKTTWTVPANGVTYSNNKLSLILEHDSPPLSPQNVLINKLNWPTDSSRKLVRLYAGHCVLMGIFEPILIANSLVTQNFGVSFCL